MQFTKSFVHLQSEIKQVTEYEKGNVKTIVAKGSFTARMQVGYLDNNFAAQKCVEIDQLMDNKQ